MKKPNSSRICFRYAIFSNYPLMKKVKGCIKYAKGCNKMQRFCNPKCNLFVPRLHAVTTFVTPTTSGIIDLYNQLRLQKVTKFA